MKILFAGFVAILTAFPVVAQQNAAGFEAFTDQLERMCNKEFVTLEQSRACKTGGMLVSARLPPIQWMHTWCCSINAQRPIRMPDRSLHRQFRFRNSEPHVKPG